ncbi:uncharacterized protein [Watersipora subatra]|uniref:uncharacterized protein n=1 Tax=Watersipora subatra TaxID=2589382 RepID=UPI00355B32EA
MRFYSQIHRVKSKNLFEQHVELDFIPGSCALLTTTEMSGAPNKAIGKWLAEKDSGNDSEPELSTFSNLNISTKPLHTRPSRSQSKYSANQSKEMVPNESSLAKGCKLHRVKSEHMCSAAVPGPVTDHRCIDSVVDEREKRELTRGLRPRGKQTLNKLNTNGSNSNSPAQTTSITKTDRNNDDVAQHDDTTPGQYSCCEGSSLVASGSTLLTMTLSQVSRNKARSRTFDASSLYSVTSDDFNESDDELISINGDSSSDYNPLPVQSPRLSSKRKRTTTLSADLEVANLLSPSVDDCFSSGDNFSISDYSEPEEPASCDIPRKRVCPESGDNRPFLDLEKMQHEVEKSASMSMKRRPRAIRIMCFSPIKNVSGPHRPTTRSQYNSREMVLATQFCPLVPVEYPTEGYS